MLRDSEHQDIRLGGKAAQHQTPWAERGLRAGGSGSGANSLSLEKRALLLRGICEAVWTRPAIHVFYVMEAALAAGAW